MTVSLDSAVMAKEEPAALQYANILPGTLKAWKYDIHTYVRTPYLEGKDFEVDYEKGTVRRLSGSAITDFATSIFYGWVPFDQDKVKSYGNDPYTVYFSYETSETVSAADIAADISAQNGNSGALKTFLEGFRGKELRLMIFGDSISTGCEAYPEAATYYGRFAEDIEKLYGIKVSLRNTSVGGDDTPAAAARFEKDVLPFPADLVCIAFGMNDQNRFGDYVPVTPTIYENHIRHFISSIKSAHNAQIVLISPCDPNENWIHTSGKMLSYVEVLKKLSVECGCTFADVNSLWKWARQRKDADSILHNCINHPNNYGHGLYAEVLRTLL